MSALFQVDKELSTLAAPHLFKVSFLLFSNEGFLWADAARSQVLGASKLDIRFKCAVQESRLRHFRELDLSASIGAAAAPDIIALLPRLPSLKKLAISGEALNRMCGPGPFFMEGGPVRSDLAHYAVLGLSALKNLVEIKTKDVELTGILPLFRNSAASLRRYDNHIHYFDGGSGLAKVLPVVQGLLDLRLVSSNDYNPGEPFDLSTVQQTLPLPPLMRLAIKSDFPHDSHLSFANAFSSTLQRLCLRWGEEVSHPSTAPTLTTETFTVVHTLKLIGTFRAIKAIIASIAPRHFPVLESLKFELVGVSDWEGAESPLHPFSFFNTLRTLSIANQSSLSSASETAIGDFCRNHAIEWVGAPTFDPASPPPSPTSSVSSLDSLEDDGNLRGSSTSSALVEGIDRTMRYFQKKLEKAKEEEDETKLKRIKAVLKPVELERTAMEFWEKVEGGGGASFSFPPPPFSLPIPSARETDEPFPRSRR